MPNLLAHYLLAKRFVLKQKEIDSKYPDFHSFLTGNQEYFYLGTQGPDPLFYMGIIPFRGLHIPTALKKYGNKIHKTDGKKYFRYLIERCFAIDYVNDSDAEQKRFMAFVFGQFAHYLLDRECHPYVLYMSGFDSDGRITGKYHYEHAHFEAKIDYCLSKEYKMDYFRQKPYDIICDRSGPLKIIDMHFVPVIAKMFDAKKLPKKMYSNGLLNFRFWQKYSNGGSKMRVFFFGKTSLSATRLPLEVNEDVLNRQKKYWLDPVTGEKHNDSFLELHSRAFNILESLYVDIIKNGFTYEIFCKYIDGRNFYGNLPSETWKYKSEE
jgi:hypothetical protein